MSLTTNIKVHCAIPQRARPPLRNMHNEQR